MFQKNTDNIKGTSVEVPFCYIAFCFFKGYFFKRNTLKPKEEIPQKAKLFGFLVFEKRRGEKLFSKSFSPQNLISPQKLSLIKAGVISVKVLVIQVILNNPQRITEVSDSNKCVKTVDT